MKNNYYNAVLALGLTFLMWELSMKWAISNISFFGGPPPVLTHDWNVLYLKGGLILIMGFLLLRSNTKNIGNIVLYCILSLLWSLGAFFGAVIYGTPFGFAPGVLLSGIALGVVVLDYYFIYKS